MKNDYLACKRHIYTVPKTNIYNLENMCLKWVYETLIF